MPREPRWLSQLDPDKRQWLLDHECAPLPDAFRTAIRAAGGPTELAEWEGHGWSWTSTQSLHPRE